MVVLLAEELYNFSDLLRLSTQCINDKQERECFVRDLPAACHLDVPKILFVLHCSISVASLRAYFCGKLKMLQGDHNTLSNTG